MLWQQGGVAWKIILVQTPPQLGICNLFWSIIPHRAHFQKGAFSSAYAFKVANSVFYPGESSSDSLPMHINLWFAKRS